VKTLFVLRHGESDWGGGGADFDRPLAPRGRHAADLVGRYLATLDQVPDLVISSGAVRALTTARRAAEAGQWDCRIQTCDRFYESSATDVLQVLREGETRADRVLLAGHEPTWSQLVQLLTGAVVRLPTAALARIDLTVDSWDQVAVARGTLIWYVTPRMLERVMSPGDGDGSG